MTRLLVHPEARIKIEPLWNGRRRVTVEPNEAVMFVPRRSTDTEYPDELIQAILEAKGPAYLCDEILRDESPTYVQAFLERDLFAYRSPEWFIGRRLLDFGCGAGASTLCLAKLFPRSEIVGVELDPSLVELARRRSRHYGYTHARIVRSPSALELPVGLGVFDAVILSAVYEHLLPKERARLLPQLWNLVKPGGVLFLNQTPHRYFPIETHTTGLPFINYLPDRLALGMARLLSGRIKRDESWDNLLRYGIRGATEGEICSLLADSTATPLLLEPAGHGIRDRIDLWFGALSSDRHRFAKRAIKTGLKVLKQVTGVTLVPMLSLMFQKREERSISANDRTLKICFVSPLGEGLYRPDSRQPFGGAEVQLYLSANELARDPAYAVTALLSVRDQAAIERQDALTVVRRQAKGRLAVEMSRFRQLCAAAMSFGEMFMTFRRIDADVFLHAGAGIEVGAYALICRMMRRKFIFMVASTADLCGPYGAVSGPLKWLYPAGVRLAHAIICRTEDQKAALRKRYGRAGHLIRTAHPIPPETDRPRTTILWAGRIHPLKQPQLFLDAAERLSDRRCVMVGMRDEAHPDLWEAVRRRAAGLRNVSFHADLPLHCMHELFGSAKVFVNTSTHEGFPNTFVQAVLNGVPIVSWIVNPDLVLSRHQIGFCAEGVFDDMVSFISYLCSEEPFYEECRRRARVYGTANHGLEQSVAQLKRLLVSVVSSPAYLTSGEPKR
jgi:glycosyltransferase involved in cell wall biosynthesis